MRVRIVVTATLTLTALLGLAQIAVAADAIPAPTSMSRIWLVSPPTADSTDPLQAYAFNSLADKLKFGTQFFAVEAPLQPVAIAANQGQDALIPSSDACPNVQPAFTDHVYLVLYAVSQEQNYKRFIGTYVSLARLRANLYFCPEPAAAVGGLPPPHPAAVIVPPNVRVQPDKKDSSVIYTLPAAELLTLTNAVNSAAPHGGLGQGTITTITSLTAIVNIAYQPNPVDGQHAAIDKVVNVLVDTLKAKFTALKSH